MQKNFKDLLKLDTTISINYINRLLLSDLFRKDFLFYLINVFFEECQAEREDKVKKLVEKMKDKNKWKVLRLPWSNEEILYAQEILVNHVYNIF